MELLCCEGEQLKKGILDPVFFHDNRVLNNLLKLEEHYTVSPKYMEFQTDIKPYMRKVVTQWMLEVCEEQRCEEEVFPLAVNFLDRFLAAYSDLKKTRLQLMATSCLFLASKLKETYPLSAEKLVIYTDNSITLQELLDWEILVLCKLKWDLGAVTPHDFVDILLHRLDLPRDIQLQVRKLTLINLSRCTKELEFVMYPASLLASGCICAALPFVSYTRQRFSQCCQTLQSTAALDVDMLRSCFEQIQRQNLAGVQSHSKEEPVSHPGTPTDTLAVQVN